MQKILAIVENAGVPSFNVKAPEGGFVASKLTYEDFACSRLAGLKKGAREPIPASDVKRMLLSKDFASGLSEIKAIAKQYGKEGNVTNGGVEKLSNFAANVNAIIKNDTLFDELSSDKALRRNWPLIKFAVAAATSGNVKDGFAKIGGSLREEERLTPEDRKKVEGMVKQVLGLKVLQKKPLEKVFSE